MTSNEVVWWIIQLCSSFTLREKFSLSFCLFFKKFDVYLRDHRLHNRHVTLCCANDWMSMFWSEVLREETIYNWDGQMDLSKDRNFKIFQSNKVNTSLKRLLNALHKWRDNFSGGLWCLLSESHQKWVRDLKVIVKYHFREIFSFAVMFFLYAYILLCIEYISIYMCMHIHKTIDSVFHGMRLPYWLFKILPWWVKWKQSVDKMGDYWVDFGMFSFI